MSRILVLAVVVALSGVSACKSVNENAPNPSAAQTAPEAKVAPQAGGVAASGSTGETPSVAAKPVATATETIPTSPASDVKPAEEVPASAHPVTKAEMPASKQVVYTKEQALALASKGNCLNCHRIESKLVGPAWKDVAAKYKGDANAVGTITSHIKSGGSFGWKLCVMPPRGGSKISDDDVSHLAKFIASLK